MAVAIVAGIAAVGSAAVAAGTLAIGWGTAAAAFAIGAGLSMVGRAIAPKPKLSTGASLAGLTTTVREPATSKKLIYGRTRIGGTIVYVDTTGTDNEYLHFVVVLAGHEIDAYEAVYFNDEKVWQGTYQSGWGSYARIKFYKGDQTTADSNLVSESTPWTSNHILNGNAYMYVRLKYDADQFPNGIPNISAIVRGKKIYDPRQDSTSTHYDASVGVNTHRVNDASTWTWSQNPALAVRDYLVDTQYGLGETAAAINSAALVTAADYCDVDTDTNSDPIPALQINGVVDTANSRKENIDSMLSAMGGMLVYSGGQYYVRAAQYLTPSVTVDETMMVGQIQVQTRQSRRSQYNGVKGVFLSKEKNYVVADYPAQISSTYATDDGDPIYLDMPLPFVTDNEQAQRLAKIGLLKSRQQTVITVPLNLSGLKFKAGDFIYIDNDKLGWDGKAFEVLDYGIAVENDGSIRVDVRCIETASSIYNWLSDDAADFLSGGELTLYDGKTTQPPTSLTATESTRINSDGAVIPTIELGWTAAADAFVDHYEVEWKQSSASTYKTVNTVGAEYEIPVPVVGVTYNTRVRAVNALGVRSTYATANVTMDGDTTAPASPSSPGTSADVHTLVVSWANPSDLDLSYIEVKRNSVNTEGTATVVGRSSGTSFVDGPFAVATTYYYWVRAVDNSGNASAWVSAGSDTTVAVDTVDIKDNAVDITKIADTLQSTNYSAGSAGWKLTTGGVFEAGDGTFRGDITASSFTIEAGATVSGIEAQAVAGLPQASFTSIGASTYSPAVNGSRVTWTETTTNESWTTKLLSDQSFGGGSFVTFVVNTDNATNARYMVGLGTATGVGFSNIDYAVYVRGTNGDILAYESGTSAGTLKASISAGDVITVLYDGNKVQYIVNGTVEREVDLTSPLSGQVYAHIAIDDGSTHAVEHRIDGLQFGPVTSVVENLNDGVSLTSGGLTLSSGGAIKGGQTAYDNGTGFFLGYENSAYKLSIGDSTGDKLTFDGADLTVTGDITATSLTLSGTSIAGGQLAQGVQDSLALADSALQIGDIAEIISAGNIPTGQLTFNDSGSKTVSYDGNNISVTGGNDNSWDTQVYSSEHYASPCVLQFETTFNSTYRFMMGLNEDPTTNASYASIDYCWYLNTSTATIYENGGQAAPDGGSFSYSVGDKFSIVYDGDNVYYYHNDTLKRTVTGVGAKDFYLDSSLYDTPLTINDVRFAPISRIDYGSIGGVTITPGKLYQGTGTFNNANTGFYLDSTGQFSLKDKLAFFPSNNTLRVKGNIEADVITVNQNLQVVGDLKASSLAIASITREMFTQDALDEIYGALATAVGGTNGDYKEASGDFTTSGGTVTLALFDHGQNEVVVEWLENYGFSQAADYTGTALQATLIFEASTTSNFATIAASKTETITLNKYDLSVYYGSTYFWYYGPRTVTKTFTTTDLADTTDYYFRVRVTSVGAAFTGITYPFELEANEGVTGVVSTGGNADTLDNLDSTAFLRSNVDDTFDGNLVVTGNLTVNGTTVTLNTATLDVEDKNITLNYGAGDTSASANGAGITIQDAVNASTDATILWDATNDEFDFSHKINVSGTSTFAGIRVNNSNTALSQGAGNSLRIQTNSGYVDVGPKNTSWAHFDTDRGKFYFGQDVHVNGQLYFYDAGTNNTPYWHAGNDGASSGLDADLLDGYHETSFVRTSTGVSSNLDSDYRAGMTGYSPSTSGTKPDTGYGQIINIVSSGSSHNNSNNWITQLAFGTGQDSSWFRSKTNSGAWGAWRTIWNDSNDGSGSGLDADLLDGIDGSSFLRSDASDNFSGSFLEFQDNCVLRFGNSADFRIWHDGGGHTYFRNYGAGTNTYFQNEDNANVNHAMIYLRGDTSAPYVQLFGDGVEALRVRAGGATVYGDLNSPVINIDRQSNTASGINWYSPSYKAWATYMAPTGAGHGPWGNITAPSGTLVTSWALRNFIENAGGYGWTFESGSATGNPTVVAEIRASDGSARFGGSVNAVSDYQINGTPVIDSSRSLLNLSGAIRSDSTFSFLTSVGGAQYGKFYGVSVSSTYTIGSYGGYFNAQNGYMVGNTTIVDSSRNLTNIGQITADDVRVTAGDGEGYGFWSSALGGAYRIYMSSAANSTYGGRVGNETTSDYNMYFKMQAGTNRGFVFRDDANNFFSINPDSGVHSEVPGFWQSYFRMENTGTANATTRDYPSQEMIFRSSGWDTNNSVARNCDWHVRAEAQPSIYPDQSLAFYEQVPSYGHKKFELHGRNSGASHQHPDAATFYGNVDIAQTSDSTGGELRIGGTKIVGAGRHMSGIESFTLAGAGSTIRLSSDRTGLIDISDSGQAWTGIQISQNEGDHWSVMGNAASFGLYDDENGKWILLHNQNGGTSFYHNGNEQFSTQSNGLHLNQFLVATQTSSNRDSGYYGDYSPTRLAHIWSMDTAYKIAADGTSASNIYGLTYSYNPDYQGTGNNPGAISGLGHQMQWRSAGATQTAIGTGVYTIGNVTAYSDRRVKANIERIPDALNKVCKLNGYTYERTDLAFDEATGEKQVVRQAGVIAQEVLEVLPEVVTGSEELHYGVAYGNMVSLLIEAIKELKDEVDSLKSQLKEKDNGDH